MIAASTSRSCSVWATCTHCGALMRASTASASAAPEAWMSAVTSAEVSEMYVVETSTPSTAGMPSMASTAERVASLSAPRMTIDSASRIDAAKAAVPTRSEEHTSELQSLMRISYAVFCLKKKKHNHTK